MRLSIGKEKEDEEGEKAKEEEERGEERKGGDEEMGVMKKWGG